MYVSQILKICRMETITKCTYIKREINQNWIESIPRQGLQDSHNKGYNIRQHRVKNSEQQEKYKKAKNDG